MTLFPEHELSSQTAIVLGLGESGTAAAELLLRRGVRVIATDKNRMEHLSARARSLAAQFIVGGHTDVPWTEVDAIVVSPGVPNLAELTEAERAGVEVIGETELASRFIDVPICAVGGTNGKSTVTVLVGELLKASGRKVFLGGNLGRPACDAPDEQSDVVVLEVSSFQMERLGAFRPRVAALLNISEDHLDRYASFGSYVSAKGNCFAKQQPGDVAIYPQESAVCRAEAARGGAQLVSFGRGGDYFVDGKAVVERSSGELFDLSQAALHGRHNHENAAAAIAMARAMGVSVPEIAEGLRRFVALPHRMTLVGRCGGVSYYDDSKATNVGSAVTALCGLSEERGVLIAGGRDKWGAYDELVEALAQKGRAAVLLGEAADRLQAAIGDVVPVERVGNMEEAVAAARKWARPGDAVLLSPACSSFDMFKNYSERGERFTEAVGTLCLGSEETPS